MVLRNPFVTVFMVGCLILAGCSSGGQEAEVAFDTEGEVDIIGPLVSDGESVWWLTENEDETEALEVTKADAETGDVEWSKPAGFGTVRPIFLHDNDLWIKVSRTAWPGELDEKLLRVDAVTGDVTGEVPIESYGVAMVDGLLWTVDSVGLFEVVDPMSLEVVETRQVYGLGSEFDLYGPPEHAVEFEDVVWVTALGHAFSLDTDTREVVDFIDFPGPGGFDWLQVHDDELWAGRTYNLGHIRISSLKIDTESGTVEEVDLFESPFGSIEHNGYLFDVVGENKVAQIDIETGETVATFKGLDPFSFVVTDGYLWANNDEQVVRYETATN